MKTSKEEGQCLALPLQPDQHNNLYHTLRVGLNWQLPHGIKMYLPFWQRMRIFNILFYKTLKLERYKKCLKRVDFKVSLADHAVLKARANQFMKLV